MSFDLLFKLLGIIFIAFAALGVPGLRSIHWGWLGVLLIGIVVLF